MKTQFELKEFLAEHFKGHWSLYQTENKTVLTRLAAGKIVQNLVTRSHPLSIALWDDEGRVLERDWMSPPEDLKKAGEALVLAFDQGGKLNYQPNLVGHGKKDFLVKEDSSALSKTTRLGGLFLKKGQEKNVDNLAGKVSSHRKKMTYMNSQGTQLTQNQAWEEVDLSLFQGDYEVTCGHLSSSLSEDKASSLLEQPSQWGELPRGDLDVGNYPVVLSSQAMSEVLLYTFYMGHFSAESLRQKMGPLHHLLGETWVSDKVTIKDNPLASKKSFYRAFDYCGQIRKPYQIIDSGRFTRALTTDREAQLGNTSSSGHNYGIRSRFCLPFDLEMQGGDHTLPELFGLCGSGLYIHQLHYLNVGSGQKMSLFGLTRGVFGLRDGQLVEKLPNMRFEIKVPELLNSILALGKGEESLQWQQSYLVPPVYLSTFSLTQKAANI